MSDELKKGEPTKVVPGSDLHFALLGVPWHFNMLRGQDYADMMGFAEAVWNAALQHHGTASTAASTDAEDAARYRWLRAQPAATWRRIAWNTWRDGPSVFPLRDAEIDAAMGESPGAVAKENEA